MRYLGRIISLPGIRQSGSVRAADQFLPGASITAVQGDAKVTTFTDESGRYTLDLAPGVWDIQVQVFGFTTVHQQVTVGAEPVYKDWTVEMPRIAGAPTPRPGKPDRESWTRRLSSAGEGAGKWPSSRKSTGGTRATGSPPRQGFQNAAVTATQDGQQALSEAASAATAGLGDASEDDEAFLVNGSTSGGLSQSSDDEARRQRMMCRGGGPPDGGGPGGPMGLNSASVTQFDFAGQIQDEQRNVVGNVRDNIKVNPDKDPNAKSNRQNFQYNAGFALGPGRYHMKSLVRENITGKMGTFEARFTVPDLSAETSGLKLSSIIWSSQREPLKTAVGVAERVAKKEISADPLIDGEEKVVPNITHVFRRNRNLYVTFDVYDAWPDPANAKARRVKVSMSLFNQKGAKAFEVGPLNESEVASTRPETVAVKFQVPLKDLAPGRYVCQINVVDEVGRKFAFPRAPLVVVP